MSEGIKQPAKRLRADVREQLRTLLLLKEHHLRLAQAQDAQAATLLKLALGVDIEQGNWELSADLRTLTQKD